MHGEGVIHGDLKGVGLPDRNSHCCILTRPFPKVNILIDEHCHTCLVDFGLVQSSPTLNILQQDG